MPPLSAPESLRDDETVALSEETSTHDPETFDYFAAISGVVAVGVVSESGVLLMETVTPWTTSGCFWTRSVREAAGRAVHRTSEASPGPRADRGEVERSEISMRTANEVSRERGKPAVSFS